MKYESTRVSLSHACICAVKQTFQLTDDASPKAIAGYVERLIFQSLGGVQSPPPQRVQPDRAARTGLKQMIMNQQR